MEAGVATTATAEVAMTVIIAEAEDSTFAKYAEARETADYVTVPVYTHAQVVMKLDTISLSSVMRQVQLQN